MGSDAPVFEKTEGSPRFSFRAAVVLNAMTGDIGGGHGGEEGGVGGGGARLVAAAVVLGAAAAFAAAGPAAAGAGLLERGGAGTGSVRTSSSCRSTRSSRPPRPPRPAAAGRVAADPAFFAAMPASDIARHRV